jgi:hypothetical protein
MVTFRHAEVPRFRRRTMTLRTAKQFRVKTAAVVAILYALCVVLPSVALALPNSPVAHCLTEGLPGSESHQHDASHQHVHGAKHHHTSEAGGIAHHGSDHDQKGQTTTCCNLFSVVAIPGGTAPVLATILSFRADFPALEDALRGRVPDRINRPPIV